LPLPNHSPGGRIEQAVACREAFENEQGQFFSA